MSIRYLLWLVALLPVSGCASEGRQLDAELTRTPNRRVEIWTVRAEDAGDVVLVRGLVRRRALDKGRLWGHIDVEARFIDGRPAVVAKALWSAPSAKSARTARYSARLPVTDADEVTNIIVSYAPGRHADEASTGTRL